MLQKTLLGIRRKFFICIAAIICIATLGLGLGLGFGADNRSENPAEAFYSEYGKVSIGQMQISAGQLHTMVIDTTGNLWAFGKGSNGRLGNMSTADSSTPINITAQKGNPLYGKQIVQVSAGINHTMVIDSSGNLWAFGVGSNGQLGNMSSSESTTPINITAQPSNPLYGKQIRQVAAGGYHTMLIDTNGNLWAFGHNNYGQLGNMTTATTTTTPINITAQSGNPLYNKRVSQVSADTYHTAVIDGSGYLWTFGYNNAGRLGDMSTTNSSTPINISTQSGNPLYGKYILQVSTGNIHTMAIDSQYNLWVFGMGNKGILGNVPAADTSTPINITAQAGNPLNGKQIVQTSGGGAHTIAIDAQGNLWTFGYGSGGRLGNMATEDSTAPINITAQAGNPINGKQIIHASTGDASVVALDAQGDLWAFGNGGNGQLGNMATGSVNSTPINITAQPGNPFGISKMQVSAGLDHTMAIDAAGNLWAFGANNNGQLGIATSYSYVTVPKNITAQVGNPLFGKQIVQVSAGGNHTLAIDSTGNLWAFGYGGNGQLGNMSTNSYNSTPENITAQAGNPLYGKHIVQVSTGLEHTLVVDSQGDLWVFGDNSYGQLGDLSGSYYYGTPINITAQDYNPICGNQFVKVSAGHSHSMAIDSDGNLWAFGLNYNGQLGNTESYYYNTCPVNNTAISGNHLYGRQIVQVSAGAYHTMAIDSDGNLWAFGENNYGQFGSMDSYWYGPDAINITGQSNNPLYGKQIMQVSAGAYHTTVIERGGNLWAFGDGGSGQLGHMSNSQSYTPINITAQSGNPLNGNQFVKVSVGDYHTIAIDVAGNFWAFGSNHIGQLGNMSTTGSSTPIKTLIPPPPVANASASLTGSPHARISVRTDFTTGWGTTTASGGTYSGWAPNSLLAPEVKRNDSTQAGRIRYEFDATSSNTVETLTINGTSINLNSYSALTLWNSILYLRVIRADSNSRLIVEMDRIDTDQLVTLAATTTRNVKHTFSFSSTSHKSSRVKVGSGAETTSLSHIFVPTSWSGNTATVATTTFTITSRVQFSRIIISRSPLVSVTITTLSGGFEIIAPNSGLTGIMSSSSSNGIYTLTIQLIQIQNYDYTWAIETNQQIEVQQIYNPPAGATSVADPALLILNSSAGSNWANAAFASPGNLFGKTFGGWYTHPDYTKGTQITTAAQLQQQISSAGGAIVFLYARWT